METTKTSESTKAKEQEFKYTNTAITDMYSKQLNLITGFYTNFFNYIMGGSKGWSQDKGFTNLFQDNSLTKLFTNPFGDNKQDFQNPFLISLEKIYGQLADYNRNLFSAFNSETKNSPIDIDISEISKKYKDTIDSQLEASKNVLKSVTEAYHKQFESAVETNKKMLEDINTQFNSLIKQTQKFWADVLQMNKAPLMEENLNMKESTQGDVKRKLTPPIPELMDHKSR